MPRHCHISRMVTTFEAKTYVLRSIGSGIMRVQTRLNAGRAMTECCTANNASSSTSITIASPIDPGSDRIDRFGHQKIADEAGHVGKHAQEQQVADNTVDKK